MEATLGLCGEPLPATDKKALLFTKLHPLDTMGVAELLGRSETAVPAGQHLFSNDARSLGRSQSLHALFPVTPAPTEKRAHVALGSGLLRLDRGMAVTVGTTAGSEIMNQSLPGNVIMQQESMPRSTLMGAVLASSLSHAMPTLLQARAQQALLGQQQAAQQAQQQAEQHVGQWPRPGRDPRGCHYYDPDEEGELLGANAAGSSDALQGGMILQKQQKPFSVSGRLDRVQVHAAGFPYTMPPHLPARVEQVLAMQQAASEVQGPPYCTRDGGRLVGMGEPYCTQIITEELNACALGLLKKLQMLPWHDSPLGQVRPRNKRFVCSLKEACKEVKSAKLLLVAPDIKDCSKPSASPMMMLHKLLAQAYAYGVPVVFALSRPGIGQLFGREKRMSVIAITDTQGCELEILSLLQLAQQGMELYQQMQCHLC